MAIRRRSVPIVEALLKHNADPNVRDADTDATPLLQVFEREDPVEQRAIVRLLLAAGADVDAASRKEGDLLMGVTPLMFAAGGGSAEIVQLLLEKGANVNARAKTGFTALSMAKSFLGLNEAVIHKLVAAGAKE